MSNDVKEYRRLPYTRRVEKVENEGVAEFVAYIAEIPWLRVYADEREEAFALLDESFDDAVQAMIDAGDDVPRPAGTLERYGEPDDPAPRPDRPRWSTSKQPDAVTFPSDESEAWASGNVDPEREIEATPA